MNGTPEYLDDDTFTLVTNGSGGLLLPIADQDSNPNTQDYRLAQDNFWRVRRYLSTGDVGGYTGDTSYWVIWDKTGTQYYFGKYPGVDTSYYQAWFPTYPSGCASITMQTWQWSLSKMKDKFGQEMKYNYAAESDIKFKEGCSGYQANMSVAVYPSAIIYPNNRYRIVFTRYTSRLDYDTGWDDSQSLILFMRSRLSEIRVWRDPDGSWNNGDEVMIRKYVLGYSTNAIFTGVTWPAGGKTPALISITEYGLNGTNALPATSFTYGDGMHLTQVDNGYGGRVTLAYDTGWSAAAGTDTILGGSFSGGAGEYYPDNYSPYGNDLDILKDYFQPGGTYMITAQVYTTQGGKTAKVGLDDGVSHKYGAVTNLTQNQWTTVSANITIAKNANKARALFYCSGDFNVGDYKVTPVLTRYRVNTKTLLDQVTNESASFTYAYSGAAVNDAGHSDYVNDFADNLLLTPAYSEFRGHSSVTETGRITARW
jgi:hypothetical protein